MTIFKNGQHRLFENDAETATVVSKMLIELERDRMDAVRKYSRQFDAWDPPSFRLNPSEIAAARDQLSDQAVRDTEFCQANVRAFAQAQMATLQPLEVETRPGVVLGHRHIPVQFVGSYIPGGRYPMFGSAQMSIIPARVAGGEEIISPKPPPERKEIFPPTTNAPGPGRGGGLLDTRGVP